MRWQWTTTHLQCIDNGLQCLFKAQRVCVDFSYAGFLQIGSHIVLVGEVFTVERRVWIQEVIRACLDSCLCLSSINQWSSFTSLQASQNRWIKLDCLQFCLQTNCFEWIELAVFCLLYDSRLSPSLFLNDNRQTCLYVWRPWKLSFVLNFALYVTNK